MVSPALETSEAGQGALFAADALRPEVTGVRAGRHDPAVTVTVLAADGYGWLAELTPDAPSRLHPLCAGCQAQMVLAATPVFWTCPACHPQEVAR